MDAFTRACVRVPPILCCRIESSQRKVFPIVLSSVGSSQSQDMVMISPV